MADRAASNYSGKSGKTNVQMQGQTKGEFGANPTLKRRSPPSTDEKP